MFRCSLMSLLVVGILVCLGACRGCTYSCCFWLSVVVFIVVVLFVFGLLIWFSRLSLFVVCCCFDCSWLLLVLFTCLLFVCFVVVCLLCYCVLLLCQCDCYCLSFLYDCHNDIGVVIVTVIIVTVIALVTDKHRRMKTMEAPKAPAKNKKWQQTMTNKPPYKHDEQNTKKRTKEQTSKQTNKQRNRRHRDKSKT